MEKTEIIDEAAAISNLIISSNDQNLRQSSLMVAWETLFFKQVFLQFCQYLDYDTVLANFNKHKINYKIMFDCTHL